MYIDWSGSVPGGPADTGYGMMSGTSPAITALSNQQYETAFQANTGMLWEFGPGGGGNLGDGMASGTNPPIAVDGSSFRIVFQANTGNLFFCNAGGNNGHVAGDDAWE